MSRNADVAETAAELLAGVRILIASIERTIPDAYTAEGLYRVLAAGYLPVPFLSECRDELRHAVRWKTRVSRGRVQVVNEEGRPVSPAQRVLTHEAALSDLDP